MKPGELNKIFLQQLLTRLFGSEELALEYKFHPVRRWRFDYAVPAAMIAVEYQGHAGFAGRAGASGHSTVLGLTRDCEKFNTARSLGWTVLTFTALHFQYKDRLKHKLTSPEETLMAVIGRKQLENENKP